MHKRFLAATLVSIAALLLCAGPAAADETAADLDAPVDDVMVELEDAAGTDPAPGFTRAAVRVLLADLFGSDEAAPAVPAEEDSGGLEAELGRRLRLELRYDSRGPFENHLTDPRETEHFVFLQLRARL